MARPNGTCSGQRGTDACVRSYPHCRHRALPSVCVVGLGRTPRAQSDAMTASRPNGIVTNPPKNIMLALNLYHCRQTSTSPAMRRATPNQTQAEVACITGPNVPALAAMPQKIAPIVPAPFHPRIHRCSFVFECISIKCTHG